MVSVRASRRPNDRGAAAVEFAFIAPLLLILVIGIISYGYMLSFRQGMSQGAAEGARAAAISVAATDELQLEDGRNAVNEALDSYGVTCDGIDAGSPMTRNGAAVGTCSLVYGPCAQDAARSCVTVTLDYEYRDNPLLPSAPGIGVVLPPHLTYTSNARAD